MLGMCVNPLHIGELISTDTNGDVVCDGFKGVNPLHIGELISTLNLIFC